jgi:S1-C subfamily serine protease
MTARHLLAILAATALAAVVAVVVIAAVGVFDSNDNRSADAQGSGEEETIHRIYQREGGAVYFVQSSGAEGAGTGTAWLFDANGHLVTNQHVISGGTDVALRIGENELAPVEVVGQDPSTDLAVLKADPQALGDGDPVRLGEASEVFVGQRVVAIGNPFGLEGTVTTGIV